MEWRTNGLPSDFNTDKLVTDRATVDGNSAVVLELENYYEEKVEELPVDYRKTLCRDKLAVDRIKQAADAGNHLAENCMIILWVLHTLWRRFIGLRTGW